MKLSKIAMTVAAVAACSFAADMKFGAVAGAGMSTMHGDNADDMKFALAYQVGGKMVMPMGGFDLAPEVIFAKRGAAMELEMMEMDETTFEVTTTKVDASINEFWVLVPVLAQFEVAPSIQLKAGPQIGINLTSTYEVDGKSEDTEDPKMLDLGLVAGAGYKINDQIAVDARFEYGFLERFKDGKIANMGFGLNGSYLF